MRLPLALWIVVVVLLCLAMAGLIRAIYACDDLISTVSDFAIILTLVTLIFYSYYTYLIARDAWIPSASFGLTPVEGDPFHFWFTIQNHSKKPVRCWCRLNASVNGTPVEIGGFYSAETPIDAQPFGAPRGHFDIPSQLLTPIGHSVESMQATYTEATARHQLRLNIDFWYQEPGSDTIVGRFNQPYFFDFRLNRMVADF